jgi:predicted fused transcriptional regulator/phosphomethylpyrimidine kinase
VGAFPGSIDETRGQAEVFPPAAFGASHFAIIRLVVEPCEVQGAVQHKYAQFVVERMAVFRCLGACAVERDCDFAEKAPLPLVAALLGEVAAR